MTAIAFIAITSQVLLQVRLMGFLTGKNVHCENGRDFVMIVIAIAHTLLAAMLELVTFSHAGAAPEVREGIGYLVLVVFFLTFAASLYFAVWLAYKLGAPRTPSMLGDTSRFVRYFLLGVLSFSGSLTPLLSDVFEPPSALPVLSLLSTSLTLYLILEISEGPM